MPGLTEVGVFHADLYPGMVAQFESSQNYCAVGRVYSVYDFHTNGNPGTRNPLLTAAPLAIDALNPFPLMQLANGNFLYENFPTSGTKQTPATKAQLRAELVSNAQGGFSSAVFWTSTGLHTLGTAIADDTNLPEKGATGTPPRNAAYVFVYNGTDFDPPNPANGSQYLQCFNVNTGEKVPSGTNFFCKSGSIEINAADIAALRGKICDTTALTGDCKAASAPSPAPGFGE